MRKTYENSIYELMKRNEKIVALVADSGLGKYEDIEKEFPDRLFNFGIAESNMIAAGGAMAKKGFIPVIYALKKF